MAVAALALLYVERRQLLDDSASVGVTYWTAIGEVRHLDLQGGRRVDLNTGSQIRIHLGSGGYVVVLTRGEARFRVQHNEHNDRVPFLVSAGSASMKSLTRKPLAQPRSSTRSPGLRFQWAIMSWAIGSQRPSYR